MTDTISVIIPVYNEERTISSIVEIVKTWGKALEIIVVNDGSTDKTEGALKQFSNSIIVVSRPENKGKGYSMAEGIRATRGELLMFLDGDVVGLTHKDLDTMVRPIVTKKADMVIGVARFWHMGSFEPYNDLSGERVILRKNVVKYLRGMKDVGYGIELFLNDIHKNKRVVSVRLPHVFIIGKMEKQSMPDAARMYVKEARELVAQLIRQQASDLAGPQATRVFRVAQSYIKQALDYLQ